MSPEERQLLAGLFDRIRNAQAQPRDSEAETFIAESVRAQPYAPYLLAQTVIVQEQALRAAADKLTALEAQVRDLEQRAASQPAQSGGFLSGLGGLFGGGAPQPAPRPSPPPSGGPWGQQGPQQPQPPQGSSQGSPWGSQPQAGPGWGQPPQQGSAWGQQPQGGMGAGSFGAGMGGGFGQPAGGGFLKGALGAAAGVAGGVLLADSMRGLFHGGNNSLGIGTGFGGGGIGSGIPGGETVVNNYYGDNPGHDQAYQDGRDDAQADAQDNSSGISDADYSSDNDDNGGYDDV